MKLKIADLQCDSLDLINEHDPPTLLQLQNIANGTGDLEFRDGLTLLNEVAIRKLLAILEFPVGDGRLRTDFPATIEHVTCQGRIRNGFAGSLRSSIVETERISLELSSVKAVAHLIAEGLHVKIDGRGGRIEVGTLTLSNAQCTMGSLLIRLGSLTITGLKVGWDGGGRPQIEASKASARDLHIQKGATTIDIDVIDLSEGLRVHERVEVQQISIGVTTLAIAELRTTEAENSEEDPSEEVPFSAPSIELNHGLFDTANGNLDVDATLSVTLPVIGKRVATHHFRFGIAGGIIDYRDFERGLADLEDAFIDLRVRGQKLVLERDIPLIPGLEKPIVTWDLDPGEVELASQKLVRIGTLLRYKVADLGGDKSKKSKVRLHRLDFDNIAVGLSLDETAILKSGEGSLRGHVDELALAGCLHFDPDPEDPVLPTSLGMTAKGLGVVARNLVVAGHALSAGLLVGSLESAQLEFDELRPKSLVATLKNISVSNLDFNLASSESP